MKAGIVSVGMICFCIGASSALVWAQDGASLFRTWCASCHEAADSRAPDRAILRQMSPEQILTALENGAMSQQGAQRSRTERRALAEYLSGKNLGGAPTNPIPKSAFCNSPANSFQDFQTGPAWNGWGVTKLRGYRYQRKCIALESLGEV